MKKSALTILVWPASGVGGFCQNVQAPSAPEPESPPKDTLRQSDGHITWVSAYLWQSGVNGNLGVSGKTIPIDASFSEIFDKLNIGYLTAVDVRKHRIGVLTDFQYVDLPSDEIWSFNTDRFDSGRSFLQDVNPHGSDPRTSYRLEMNDENGRV